MNKIDIHTHITSKGIFKIIPVLGNYKDMSLHSEQLGINHTIVLSGGEKTPLGILNNSDVSKIVKSYPERYSWMCNLSESDIDTVEERLRNLKAEGAVGIGEFTVNKRIDNPFVQAVFSAAENLDMPLLFHMSPVEGKKYYGIVDEAGLPLLEQALRKYPKLKFIGHSQPFWHEISGDADKSDEARNSWGEGPVAEGGRLIELFEKYDTLHGDLSANSGGQAIMRDEKFGLAFIERFSDRLMFGTDMANKKMVFPLSAWMDERHSQGKISDESYEKIFYKNAVKVFHIYK